MKFCVEDVLNEAQLGEALKRILVVDDEEQIRTMVKLMLEQAGFEVDVADNGASALICVQQNNYSMVITDMVMPVNDGLKLILELTKEYPQLKIMAISGGGAIKAERYLTMVGYLGDHIVTLQKPFKQEDLLALVEKQLEN